MPEKKERRKKEASAGVFRVSLVFSTYTITKEGASILECLNQFERGTFKGKCILRVEHDGKVAEKAWYPFRLKRLVANLILRKLVEKWMLVALR